MLTATWNVLLELAPWLLLGMGAAGALHGVLPRGFLRKHLRGRTGVIRAVILGVPLPLCSCSVIPTGIGLKEDGASDGAAVGFLISTPQTGIDSILVTASFLGWPFALFKMFSAALTGLVGGFITEALTEEQNDASESDLSDNNPRPGLSDMVKHSLSIVESIWMWLAFGVLASAAISTYLPSIGLTTVNNLGSLGAVFVVLIISVPLYVCATASVPIAAALVAGGMPTGAALVFLMAGPATNIATVGAVHRAFGKKVLTVYLGTIVVGSVGLAYLFDALFESSVIQAGSAHHHESPFAVISAVALLALFLWFGVNDIRQRLKTTPAPALGEPRLEVPVTGMTCEGCVRKLTGALNQEEGITRVEVTLQPGRAIVYGNIADEHVRQVIENAGFKSG